MRPPWTMSNIFIRLLIAFIYVSATSYECEATPLSTLFSRETSNTCGYQSCPRPVEGKINVHVVPHTHDDVGWLKTVDQYYWGSRTSIQKAGVQYILDSVIQELVKDPSRRFIYVETFFLWKWWLNQNDKVRNDVQRLIDEGRLEIISGAWSMNDEAVTHYQSIIDQFTWGLRRLNDTFGSCARPHIGWQIDPFGHSREQASIFAQMGFDGFFFGRLDYQDKNKRLNDKTAEMIWRGSGSLGDTADLFTGVLFNGYSPPPGFCFDVLCSDEPIIDDDQSPDYNVDKRIGSFVKYFMEQSKYYRTNNIILTMGGDFTYQDAEMGYKNLDKLIRTNNIILTMGDDFHYQSAEVWFRNLDKLIRYTNERNGSTVNVFYSTPSCYLKALNDAGISWPTKSDDFFPYASDPHSYWTGYFTSRPTIKYYERLGNNLLQISKQLSVLGGVPSPEKYLIPLREAMGIMQHHDAITGTEKQHVAQDYARILYAAIDKGEEIISLALEKLMTKVKHHRHRDNNKIKFNWCHQMNISACPDTEINESFVVTLYNPQSRKISSYVRVPVTGESYGVKDFTGTNIVTQIVPIPAGVKSIPGRESLAVNELVFRAVDVPALGYQSYYISVIDEPATTEPRGSDFSTTIQNEFFNVTAMENGGTRITRVTPAGTSPETSFEQSFYYYEGSRGDNSVFANRSSGAYIFRPKDATAHNLSLSTADYYKGPLVQEFHMKIDEWVSQVVRLYAGEDSVEFDWVVGPIPVDDKIGKEIITRYSSNLDTRGVFYTDSNGREMLKRERNFRPTWDLKLEEPVAGNYYPVTSKITVKDKARRLRMSVLNDRAQGGSSLNDGQVELMVHRRLLSDDDFGVGEALNEQAYGKGLVVRGRHVVLLTGGTSAERGGGNILEEKELAWNLLNPPCIMISPTEGKTFDEWRDRYRMRGSGLAKELPANVRVLTLEPWKDGSLLIRLEHMFEFGEDTRFSHPVEINIKDLFAPLTLVSVRETMLAGNQWKNENERLQWTKESNDVHRDTANANSFEQGLESGLIDNDGAINVLLKPMQIRTFVVNFELN